jgi:pyrroloquinoline quinone biosynthesis protein D
MNVTLEARPALGPGMRLQWEPAQEAHVLLFPEGMVKLNGSAAAILTRCDGLATVSEIVGALEQTYGTTGLEAQVLDFLAHALQRRWVAVSA